jgi:anaerobilin synthase
MMEAIKNALGKEEFAILSKKIEEKGMMKVLGKELVVNKKLRKMMMSIHKGGQEKRLEEQKEDEFSIRLKSHHNSSGVLDEYIKSEKITEEDFEKKMNEFPKDVPRVIYVHTPYCDKICSFCNLNREQIKGSLDEYADYLVSEFEKYGKYKYVNSKPFNVIFFGGGTPTVYKGYQLEKILKSVRENIDLVRDYEFTLETTLHNLNDEKIEILNRYGVNRLSVGIQSFSEIGREFYNRTYGKNQVIERIKDLKEKFNGEVCVDIIYNYPNQSVEEVVEDAKIIKELDLGSSSFYSLMVHEGSELSKDVDNGNVKMLENLRKERALHDAFVKELTNTGEYYPLELTKIAKKGRDNYQYIKARNDGGDTLPIGVGAGGRVDNIGVFRMSKEMSFFAEKSNYYIIFEKLAGLMQFPVVEKVKVKKILSEREYDLFAEKMDEYVNKDLLTEGENSYSLTSEGIFWGNNMSKGLLKHVADRLFKK